MKPNSQDHRPDFIKKSEVHSHKHQHSQSKKNNPIKLFLLRWAHSNGYVSIPILAITMATYLTVGSYHFDWNYVAFLFFSTLFLYPLHRLAGLRLTLPLEYSQAQKSVKKTPQIARTSLVIGFIGTTFFAFQLSKEIFQFLIPLGVISITYSLPLIPTQSGWKRLRDIPGIKIYAISIVVTLTTSTIPLLLLHQFGISDLILLGFQRLLFILAITIPFDVRDIRIDQKWSLKTIPILFGKERALKLSIALLVIASLLTGIQYLNTEILNIAVLLAILISHVWTIYILEKFKKYNAPLFNAYLLEGTMVFQFSVITIAQVLISF